MENRIVGWLIIGISLVIIGIILLFNRAMISIVEQGCPIEHVTGVCPAYDTITDQTYLSLAIVGVLIIIGLFLLFSKPETKVIIKQRKEKEKIKSVDMSAFTKQEKQVIEIVREQRGIFQADLIEKTGLGKTKVTRILDKLEAKEIIERRRRGMQNFVVFK